ncbi:AraC family transcriptional regulator, partial [Rhodoblastus acidophilus]|nr:AraC family transcriptional regulator [Rhodoblastus acidophilus]
MFLRAHPFALRTLLLAGAAALAAPLLLSFAPSPAPAPEPTATPAAPLAHGEGETRSYAYYPEQLAALFSLNSFAPVADPGRPAASAAPGPTAPPPARAVRPPEARRAE